ncbi:hypothetical protein HTY52_12810 [Cupriavidus taiwanensis]|uniref:hypothetical protein n=1 Tax=Cupriavidus taiwanensis TaxID=164546 RepID=UPI0015727F47|nr:hypothetical protein [Cupriavidus taiwanensis]NSX14956.1 hypothetical protein [Cupriavidus taiwanensis]
METDHLLLRVDLQRTPNFAEQEANLKYLERIALEQAAAASGSATAAATAKTAAESARDAANDSRVNAAQSKSDAAASAVQAVEARQAAETARDVAQQHSNQVAPSVMSPGDGNATTERNARTTVLYAAPISAPRTITLNATDPIAGDMVKVARLSTGTGVDVLDFGGLKYLTPSQWAEATYTGTAWVLTAYGNL